MAAQADESQRAWDHLHDVFAGASRKLQGTSNGTAAAGTTTLKGVRDIEDSLTNMDSFLGVLDEVMRSITQVSLQEV